MRRALFDNMDEDREPLSYWGRKLQAQIKRNEMNAHARPLRGGMQVHAVPESERAIDANGQRLPWAYEYAE